MIEVVLEVVIEVVRGVLKEIVEIGFKFIFSFENKEFFEEEEEG